MKIKCLLPLPNAGEIATGRKCQKMTINSLLWLLTTCASSHCYVFTRPISPTFGCPIPPSCPSLCPATSSGVEPGTTPPLCFPLNLPTPFCATSDPVHSLEASSQIHLSNLLYKGFQALLHSLVLFLFLLFGALSISQLPLPLCAADGTASWNEEEFMHSLKEKSRKLHDVCCRTNLPHHLCPLLRVLMPPSRSKLLSCYVTSAPEPPPTPNTSPAP